MNARQEMEGESAWPQRTIHRLDGDDLSKFSDAEADLLLTASEDDPVYIAVHFNDLPGPSLAVRYRISEAWRD